MVRYCPGCGRSIPLDARLCPYCGKTIAAHEAPIMPDPGQKKDKTVLIIVAIIIILFVVVPIAIAATVYVYVSGMVPQTSSNTENAVVIATDSNDRIQVTLVSVGQNYNSGYSNFMIYVDGSFVEGLENIGYWMIGEPISIGTDTIGRYTVEGNALSAGEYDVSVAILDTVVYMGSVSIV